MSHSCEIQFKTFMERKNHNFLFHYKQKGGSRNRLPINTLRRGHIICYSINYQQHKDLYDFYDEKIVDQFLDSVKEVFNSASCKEYKIQGYFELRNFQQTEAVELENRRVWLTNIYLGKYFNDFIRGEIKSEILKRVIINDATGSSWRFRRFNRLQINATDKASFMSVLSG